MAGALGPLQTFQAGLDAEPVIDDYATPLSLWSAQWVPAAWVTRLDTNATVVGVPADISSVNGAVVTSAVTVEPIAYPSDTSRPYYLTWNVIFWCTMAATVFWMYTEVSGLMRMLAVRKKQKRVPTALAVHS